MFEGGAPVDCTYYWCSLCGCLRVDAQQDGVAHYAPGTRSPLESEPPCVSVRDLREEVSTLLAQADAQQHWSTRALRAEATLESLEASVCALRDGYRDEYEDSLQADRDRMELALRNVLALTRRIAKVDPENAAHLRRFCAQAGVELTVLRGEGAQDG